MSHSGEDFARQADIDAILEMKQIAVVGLSSDPSRTSYAIARYLQSQGYEVVPINPNEANVLGERAYSSLRDLPEPPEAVDVFRRAEFIGDVVDEAIAVGAKAIWIQSGIINREAALRARQAGLITVMDRCIMVEHSRRR